MPNAILRLFFAPQGRVGRTAFHVALATASIVTLVALHLDGAALQGRRWTLATAAIFALFSYVCWCLHIKRSHDFGRSGWWLLIWIVALPILWLALALAVDHGVASSGTLSFRGWMLRLIGVRPDDTFANFKAIDTVTWSGLPDVAVKRLGFLTLAAYLISSLSLAISLASCAFVFIANISGWSGPVTLLYVGLAGVAFIVNYQLVRLHWKAGDRGTNSFGPAPTWQGDQANGAIKLIQNSSPACADKHGESSQGRRGGSPKPPVRASGAPLTKFGRRTSRSEF